MTANISETRFLSQECFNDKHRGENKTERNKYADPIIRVSDR